MTKIGYSHVKELGDLQGVLRAKTEAFAYMKPDGIAVMNGDDELLSGYNTERQTITFGLDEHNDVRAANVRSDSIDTVEFDILSDKGQFHAAIPAYGSHLAALAPAAVIIARILGMTDEEICRGFMSYAPVEGRSNVKEINGIIIIDDCYNANPNSVKAGLSSLSALPGRHVAILGDMLNLGEHSVQMHHEVGVFVAQSGVERLLCYGQQARNIYFGYISAIGGKLDSGDAQAEYYMSMSELIDEVPKQIKKGDAVLVKASRGMHFEQVVQSLLDK